MRCMHFPKVHFFFVAVAIFALVGCVSTITNKLGVSASPARRAAVARLVKRFAKREGFDRAPFPDNIPYNGPHLDSARYRHRFDANIILQTVDYIETVQTCLFETRRFRVDPTDRFSRLDTALKRDFRENFGTAATFTAETRTSLW